MTHEIKAPVTGSIWLLNTADGQRVESGETVLVMECMKMEFPVATEAAGTIRLLVQAGDNVSEQQVLALVE